MLHERHQKWLEDRGIQSATAEKMEVSTVSDSQGNWLTFPYRLDGVLVNRKYRLTADKRHRMDKGGKQIGRASCRERVCQYVLISVVVVSLKKKKQEYSNLLKTSL